MIWHGDVRNTFLTLDRDLSAFLTSQVLSMKGEKMIGLKTARQELGLSQSEIARRTGTMHPNSVYMIETGKRKAGYKSKHLITKVMKEAGWTGDPDELFEEVGE